MVWYGIGTQTRTPAAVRVSFGSLLVQREQWDTSWGPKKLIFLIRDVDDAAMAAAPAESCQFVVLRSPRGRLGSVRDTCNRLQRMRGRFRQYIHISTGPQPDIGPEPKSPKFWIQSSLGSPKYRRMRSRRLPDPRPIREGVREPICIRKKCAIWTRWRPVPVKNVNFSRAPGIVIAVSSDPILPHR
jgi:hypothetical protein